MDVTRLLVLADSSAALVGLAALVGTGVVVAGLVWVARRGSERVEQVLVSLLYGSGVAGSGVLIGLVAEEVEAFGWGAALLVLFVIGRLGSTWGQVGRELEHAPPPRKRGLTLAGLGLWALGLLPFVAIGYDGFELEWLLLGVALVVTGSLLLAFGQPRPSEHPTTSAEGPPDEPPAEG